MLPINWHRHFAKKRASDIREHRLLCFAGNTNATDTEPEEDPLATNETFAGAGLNPDGTPETPAENENVDEAIDATRSAMGETMQNSDGSESNEIKGVNEMNHLLEKIQETQQKLLEITRNQSVMRGFIMKKVHNKAERETHLADLSKITIFTEMALRNLADYEGAAMSLQRFTSGAIPPEDFEKEFSSMTSGNEGEIENFNAEDISAKLASIDAKNLLEPERSEARESVFSNAIEAEGIQHVAKFIEAQIATINESIEPIEEYSEELENFTKDEKGEEFSWSKFWSNTTSINNLTKGTKKYIEAIKKSFEEWNQLKEARVAQGIGSALSWIPLGQQTQSVLERQTEQLNDEIRDGEKKRLETMKPSFGMIIGMLNNSKKNPHHFRALLEYAAERAWLYDYDGASGRVFGINVANYLPSTWNEGNKEEYLRDLNNKNGSGQSSEKKRGYDLVDTDADIAPIIETLHDELTRGNYWASYGILERAMEKGKEGETSTWICVTIFRYLRDNSNAKKYFPINLLDALGNIGIGHPAWTSTYFKIDRSSIAKFQKGTKSFQEAGTLASAISAIEEHIDSTGYKAKDEKEYDKYVAKILATQTIKLNGQEISIFDDRHNKYRTALGNATTNVDPKSADEDFFNYQSGGSEMILLGNQSFNNMLKIESYGSFTDQYRSNALLEQVIFRADNLEEKFGANSSQLINHVSATKSRLTHWLKTNANDNRSAEKIANNTFQETGKLIFMTLIKRGLLDLKPVLALGTTALGPIIVRQLLEDKEKAISGAEIMRIAGELKANLQMKSDRYEEIENLVNLYGNKNNT